MQKWGGGQIIYLKKGPESQQVPYDQILKLLTYRTLAANGCAQINR